jgi:EAL domain-containing protein (putative c-di-GMP-specific phosphodiesterase class I)
MLSVFRPDLVVVGLSPDGIEAGETLKELSGNRFAGLVLLLGAGAQPSAAAAADFGEKLGLAILPMLPEPFCKQDLRESVAALLPVKAPNPPVDVDEALQAGWLELWYQPKVDARTLALRSAEALVRMRHPYWGVVQPSCFIPEKGDPRFRALSEFVIRQAVADWRYFLAQQAPLDISINLSIPFLNDPSSFNYLCEQLPDHPAFSALIVEVDGSDVARDLPLALAVAERARCRRVVMAIDDLGEEWPAFARLDKFPFVKIKVDRKFVSGCADDHSKQKVCRKILALADGYGARTVAEGVDTRVDFLAVRAMGFDLIQGFLFGKPMTADKFARKMLCRPTH